MKKIITFGLMLTCVLFWEPVLAQNETKASPEPQIDPAVVVYYFHYTRRCATCNAVEDVARNTVIEHFGQQVDFESCNLDETVGELIGEDFDVTGQTLLLVSKDNRIDLTTKAFLWARSNPDKLKKLLIEQIDSLL